MQGLKELIERLKFKLFIFLVTLLACLIPTTVWAKAHGDCRNCHQNAEADNYTLISRPTYNLLNPFTSKPYGVIDALCMSCHQEFKAKSIHPVGIIPRKISLPNDAKGFPGQENQITCCSCHDPHPENKNYMYLRWSADEGINISKFCVAKCHLNLAKPRLSMRK